VTNFAQRFEHEESPPKWYLKFSSVSKKLGRKKFSQTILHYRFFLQNNQSIKTSSFGTFTAAHSLKKTKSLTEQVDFASLLCIFLYSTFDKVIFGQKTATSVGISTVLA
jgi:hypothetical protein